MKNALRRKIGMMAATLLTTAMFMVSCGGSAGGDKVKENEYLGKLPAIYSNYRAELEALKAKTQEEAMKLYKDQKVDQIKEQQEKAEMKEEAMENKFNADVVAEIKTLVGRGIEIPVSYSEALKSSDELFFTVETPCKLVGDDENDEKLNIVLKFTANANTQLGEWANVRVIASDNSTLGVWSVRFNKGTEVSAGETIKEVSQDLIGNMIYDPADWADFAGIEFCTLDEME